MSYALYILFVGLFYFFVQNIWGSNSIDPLPHTHFLGSDGYPLVTPNGLRSSQRRQNV